MKKKMLVYFFIAGFCQLVMVFALKAQDIAQKLHAAVKLFEKDTHLRHAIFSLYVVDSKSGKPVYKKNDEVGLCPASSQKVIASVTAMELLGTDYRYKTQIGYEGEISEGVLKGRFHLNVVGDPTLGSWRYAGTSPTEIKSDIIDSIRKKGIRNYVNDWIIYDTCFESQNIPGGWPWEDIGNYYGAGFNSINWRENQADIYLRSEGIPGDTVRITRIDPSTLRIRIINELKKGKPASGDNAYFFSTIAGLPAYLRGTIPANEKNFKISIAVQDSYNFFLSELSDSLEIAGIKSLRNALDRSFILVSSHKIGVPKIEFFYTHNSPTLDSINYWFLKKSVNLYGEALVKTIAFEKTGFGSTEGGLDIIQEFWQKRGIERSALNITDGSGLSPQNRVTTNALVTMMQYAKTRSWYNLFHHALPEINGIRMKSGSIGGVRSFTGYIRSKSGKEYTFAFIVNNYSGSSSSIVNKMWKVLDVMK
jgi:serine-type D-Ala-D-Ala carboxypeptidase/endopeptidase (penicillin-binding protein 4)